MCLRKAASVECIGCVLHVEIRETVSDLSDSLLQHVAFMWIWVAFHGKADELHMTHESERGSFWNWVSGGNCNSSCFQIEKVGRLRLPRMAVWQMVIEPNHQLKMPSFPNFLDSQGASEKGVQAKNEKEKQLNGRMNLSSKQFMIESPFSVPDTMMALMLRSTCLQAIGAQSLLSMLRCPPMSPLCPFRWTPLAFAAPYRVILRYLCDTPYRTRPFQGG